MGRDLRIPSPALCVLWNRGLRTAEEVERFLHPRAEHLADGRLLTDMGEAVARFRQALEAGERIAVFGDYDVDGITAAVLLTRVLRHLGAPVELLVPDRMRDGFGLSIRAVEEAGERGATVLAVADCGSGAHQAAERARELGIDLVVADHHVPEAVLAPVRALVNPQRPGDRYPFRDLAAVGVAFKILQTLIEDLDLPEARAFLLRQTDLVALGTVADVVPLRGENRVLVHLGLRCLEADPAPAMRALVQRAGLEGVLLDAGHLAYFIAPRLNASGRLGAPVRALQLLLSDDWEEASSLAALLEEDNRERRRLNERVLADALGMLERGGSGGSTPIVLGSADWHPGVLGIAASRLAERFRVPAVLVSLQGTLARGSGRTPAGIDLLGLIASSASQLAAFGGHKQAVGLSLLPERFERFRADLLATMRLAGTVAQTSLMQVDGELDPCQCTVELVECLERMAPYGAGNPEPLFTGRGLCVGTRVEQGKHLRFKVGAGKRGTDCVGFGLGARAAELPNRGAVLEFVYHPTINRHRGTERVQLKLREFRLCEAREADRPAGPTQRATE